jgi:hypothetical protein
LLPDYRDIPARARYEYSIRVGLNAQEAAILKTEAARRDIPIAAVVREWLIAGRKAVAKSRHSEVAA